MVQACSLCGTASGGDGGVRAALVCEDCAGAFFRFSAFLESLDSPAALVDRALRVVFANSHLCRIGRVCGDKAVGLGIGEALGCLHAGNVRSCGESDACLHCWLKRSAELARISGERLPEMPWDFAQTAGARRAFTIAAEKADQAVVLVIKPRFAETSEARVLL